MKNNCGTMTEQNTMYFHPDHLGSSSYVTDKKGNFFEMIEYLPYGETLYDEAATVDKTEFRFTSKEQDAETGLYYHGARYRDAKTGVWLSVDPIFEMYLPMTPIGDREKEHNMKLPGLGGVFNSVNLNMYHYAGNNPVRFVDPDGNRTTIADIFNFHFSSGRDHMMYRHIRALEGDDLSQHIVKDYWIDGGISFGLKLTATTEVLSDYTFLIGVCVGNPGIMTASKYISLGSQVSQLGFLYAKAQRTDDISDWDAFYEKSLTMGISSILGTVISKGGIKFLKLKVGNDSFLYNTALGSKKLQEKISNDLKKYYTGKVAEKMTEAVVEECKKIDNSH